MKLIMQNPKKIAEMKSEINENIINLNEILTAYKSKIEEMLR